jgi:hypothetical protein
MQIEIESNVGQCGFRIAAEINPEKLAKNAAEIAGWALWHKVQSAMHAGGKKAQFNSKSEYSDALALRGKTDAERVLGEYFDDVQAETFLKPVETPESKFLAWAKKLGLDEAKTREALASAKTSNGEKPAEQPEEIVS